MTRSAKDLRDIINVSRLSIRTSSEDEYSSDDIPINLEAKNDMKLNQYLNNRPTSAIGESSFDTLPIQTRPKSAARNRDPNSFYQNRPSTAPNSYIENPAATYGTSFGGNTVPGVNYKITDTEIFNKYTPIPPISSPIKNSKQKNFDNLFPYLDTTIINGWLEELNSKLEYINKLMKKPNNFLEFANFFLVDLPSEKYKELLDLEFSIVLDQLKYAFHAGFSEDAINLKDLHTLATSVIKEYPKKLKKEKKGPELLLNITLIFCSEKDETYRKLLRNVNCFTDNKLYIQWLLAIRAFGLIGFITGIFKFFENIQQLQEIFNKKTEDSDTVNKGILNLDELAILCIKKDHTRVLGFFSDHGHVSLKKVRDKKSRNLLFVAVAEGNIEAINYLVKVFYIFFLIYFKPLFPRKQLHAHAQQ